MNDQYVAGAMFSLINLSHDIITKIAGNDISNQIKDSRATGEVLVALIINRVKEKVGS